MSFFKGGELILPKTLDEEGFFMSCFSLKLKRKQLPCKSQKPRRLLPRRLREADLLRSNEAKLNPLARALGLASLLAVITGCTPEGLRLLGQLEATQLKKDIIADRIFCKDNVGADSEDRQELCADFFAAVRMVSHCVEMRKTEVVKQEHCEGLLYRMLIRPTRLFGGRDEVLQITGADEAARKDVRRREKEVRVLDGRDWFENGIFDAFLHPSAGVNAKSATENERKLILKRIAETQGTARGLDGATETFYPLAQGILEQDKSAFWRGLGTGNISGRLIRLFGAHERPRSAGEITAAEQKTAVRDKLDADLDPAAGNQELSFLKIALSQDPVNIRAVQWIDEYLYEITRQEASDSAKRTLYLKYYCSLDWDDATDQKMLQLHETEEEWLEDNKFFVMLLASVLENDRPGNNAPGWWPDDWTRAPGADDIAKTEAVFSDDEWRSGTANICSVSAFAPFQ